MTRVGQVRQPGWVRALTLGVLAIVVGVLTSAEANATPAISHYDTAAYVYDVPARLSPLDTVAAGARGSPERPGVTSWGNSVSVRADVVAANTARAGADDVLNGVRLRAQLTGVRSRAAMRSRST